MLKSEASEVGCTSKIHSRMNPDLILYDLGGNRGLKWAGRPLGVSIRKVVRNPDFIARNACWRSLGRSLGDRSRSLGFDSLEAEGAEAGEKSMGCDAGVGQRQRSKVKQSARQQGVCG